jgi:hypothetical protein
VEARGARPNLTLCTARADSNGIFLKQAVPPPDCLCSLSCPRVAAKPPARSMNYEASTILSALANFPAFIELPLHHA